MLSVADTGLLWLWGRQRKQASHMPPSHGLEKKQKSKIQSKKGHVPNTVMPNLKDVGKTHDDR
jgi:hypothetical protein